MKKQNPNGPGPADDRVFISRLDGSEQRYVRILPPGIAESPQTDVLIALHGHGSDRWQYVEDERGECKGSRDVASRHGMIFISPDYRGNSWMGASAEADLVQLIGDLKHEYRVGKVILSGGSMGGTSALIFAMLHPGLVDGVLSQNSMANLWEYDPPDEGIRKALETSYGGDRETNPGEYERRSAELHPEQLGMPLALTLGGKDTLVPPESALRLAQILGKTHPRFLLIHRPEAGHYTDYQDTVDALEFVLARTAQANAPALDLCK